MDHEVFYFPRMIAQLESMNTRQGDHEQSQENEIMIEPQKVFLQMKETLNYHQYISLLEVFKEKECIEVRIGDFDIDHVLYEEK
jgi:hypothetical protein